MEWLWHELYLAYLRRLNFWIMVLTNEDLHAFVAICFAMGVLWAEAKAIRGLVRMGCTKKCKKAKCIVPQTKNVGQRRRNATR